MHEEGQGEYRVERAGWPPGPWDNEPDRWEGRHAGLPVLCVRNDFGAWCGYVGVPPGHPWRAGHYDELEVRVHGGLTYCAPCQSNGGPICHVPAPGEPDDVLWFGFDCNHAGDLAPGQLAGELGRIRGEVDAWFMFPNVRRGDVYRPLAYVQEQTRGLAVLAAAAAAR